MNQVPTKADAIIIGSGAAGLAAAVTLAEGGAKVIVFEKQRSLGGTSNFFQGTFAVESKLQRARYIDYSRDEAFRDIMEYSHWRANPRLVRAIVNESAKTIEWLQEHGVVIMDATINLPDSPRTYHTIQGTGEAVVKVLVTRAKEAGADVRTGMPVARLLKQGGGISGVLLDDDGEEVPVSARVVVIASGGYANNKEWIKKYTGFDLNVNLFPVGNVDKTGDGIRMAFESGAAEEGINVIEIFRVGPAGPAFSMGCNLEMAAAQPDLWVTARGERFCDETIGSYDSSIGNASARYRKDGYTYSIFDDGVVDRLMTDGVDNMLSVAFTPGTQLIELRKELDAALAAGGSDVFGADSIEGLAEKTGCDPATLKATLDEYNAACDKGYDELFVKERKYLRRLDGPNYYAVKNRTVFLGTMGGIRINERAEVIDKNEAVIPGLYAAGFDAAGMYGDSYPIRCSSGLASAFALNSGRIAGRTALTYLGK